MGLPGSHPRTSDADEADDIELLKAKERLDDADLEKEIECEADTEALLLEDHRASADRDFDSTGHRREDIERHEDPREKRLVWKLDKVILPLAMLLYLSAYLDRGNLGNARLQGLQAEILHGSDTKYSIALSCFFITYILLSIPGTLLAKAILPSRCIAIGALIWSAAAAGQAFASGPRSLYLCRLFVGVGEAMFGQSMSLYFTIWYKKTEIAKRIGLFIACGAFAGAFGGLLAYAVATLSSNAKGSWRILFLVEGVPSLVLAVVVLLHLPTRPESSRYLTREEQHLACRRLRDSAASDSESHIDWVAVKRAFTDWKTYVAAVMYSCMNLGLSSVGGFLPTIVQGLGFSDAQAQLYTVPPYAVTVVFMFLLTHHSDKSQSRGIPTAGVFLLGALSWSVLWKVDAQSGSLRLRYLGCVGVVAAGYSAIPLIISWQSSNCASESQRAVALGMLNTVGQCLSVLAGFLFPSSQGPQFKRGTGSNIAAQLAGCTIALLLRLYYRRENARRAAAAIPSADLPRPRQEMYDQSPAFRYVL